MYGERHARLPGVQPDKPGEALYMSRRSGCLYDIPFRRGYPPLQCQTIQPVAASASRIETCSRIRRLRRIEVWWSQSGSNRRPPACKAGALPAELWPLMTSRSTDGGPG
jgi:hypothetical protein